MQISEAERRFVKMIYVHNEQTVRTLQWELNKFLSENKNDILKIDRRGLPILVEMKNGDTVLFMTFIVFISGKLEEEIIK